MIYFKKNIQRLIAIVVLTQLIGCGKTNKNTTPLFQTLTDNKTGLHFTNKLTPTQEFNVFHYMYYYLL